MEDLFIIYGPISLKNYFLYCNLTLKHMHSKNYLNFINVNNTIQKIQTKNVDVY